MASQNIQPGSGSSIDRKTKDGISTTKKDSQSVKKRYLFYQCFYAAFSSKLYY